MSQNKKGQTDKKESVRNLNCILLFPFSSLVLFLKYIKWVNSVNTGSVKSQC